MRRSHVVRFCLLVLLISPLALSAQSNKPVTAGSATRSNPSPAITSVHELQIPEKARAACDKGTRKFAAKDPTGSIPEFQKAIKVFPGYYEAYAKLGAAELDLEQWDAAESAFRKSMELSGGRYAPANFGFGLILATVSKQFTQAESVVRAGLEMDPTDVTGHFVLGWVLYSTARLQEAEKSAREAILSEPNFAGARLLLAQIHLQQNRFSSVVEDLDAYLALGLTSPLDDKVRAVRAEAIRALPAAGAEFKIAEDNR
jgi:tetratricopeptide (TPR) repeat protein